MSEVIEYIDVEYKVFDSIDISELGITDFEGELTDRQILGLFDALKECERNADGHDEMECRNFYLEDIESKYEKKYWDLCRERGW